MVEFAAPIAVDCVLSFCGRETVRVMLAISLIAPDVENRLKVGEFIIVDHFEDVLAHLRREWPVPELPAAVSKGPMILSFTSRFLPDEAG